MKLEFEFEFEFVFEFAACSQELKNKFEENRLEGEQSITFIKSNVD